MTPATQRILILTTFVNNAGTGLYLTGGALYFTRVVGLSAAQVGYGFSAAALTGLVVNIPAGRLTDRGDPVRLYAASLSVGAVGMVLFLFSHTLLEFLLVCGLAGCVSGANQSIRPVLIRAYAGSSLVALRSGAVAATNLGISLGLVLAGLALQSGSPLAYRLLIAGNGVSFAVAALLCLRLPAIAKEHRVTARTRILGTRDRPFVTATVLNAVYSLQFAAVTFALPLWVVTHTSAPRWTVTGALLANTLLVSALQVRVGKRVTSVAAAASAFRFTGGAVCGGFILLGAGALVAGYAALAVVLLGVLALTLAELAQSAAALELSYGLAPAGRQGEYSGLFLLGQGAAQTVAPVILALICLRGGWPGWTGFGSCFLLLALVAPRLLTRAVSRAEGSPCSPALNDRPK